MKLLFVINKFAGGGRERRLVQLIRGLEQLGEYEMEALLFFDQITYREVLKTSLKITVLNSKSRSEQIWKLKDAVSTIKPDIIHNWIETPTECVFLPLFAKLYGAKYIAGFVADGNRIIGVFNRLSIAFTFRMADAIVSNSKAGLLAKGAPSHNSHIIYNGFDFGRIPEVSVAEVRNPIGVSSKYMVSMCARVNDAKNWDMFFDLAKKTLDNNEDIQFVAVGSGEKLDDYRQLVQEQNLSNIRFIGHRSDVESIIVASDVCVMFTNNEKHAEGVSNFIMESMASGKPVIATAGGGTAEIISNGIDGYIIEPNNVEEAYSKLKIMIEQPDLIKELGSQAQKKIKSQFLLSQMTENYNLLYKKLVVKQ
ncbi:glycosyltransferase family 4 protein [Bacteroides graminisolvens]